MKLRIPSSLSLALAISIIASHYSPFVEGRSRSSAGGRGAGVPSRPRGVGPTSSVSSSAKRSSSSSSSRGESLGHKDKGPSRPRKQQIQEDLDFGRFPGDDDSEMDYDDVVEDDGSRASYDEFDQNILGSEEELEEGHLEEQDDYFYNDEFDDYRDDGRSERGLREKRQSRGGRPGGSSARRGASTGGRGEGRRNVPSSSGRGTGTASSSSSSRDGRSGGRRPNGIGSSSSAAAGDRKRGGRVVPYGTAGVGRRGVPQPGAFARGLSALRESIPDPSAIKDTALQSLSAAKETTSKLSSNLYREIKGLTSSELEQVMLKATQPNDLPVKGKHVERLVGVTYQISGRYDIYDAVLRKLWSKMVEKDWRTTIKALYILHRFSADGAPDHQAALKARLRELRRTRDPKRKEKYFNSKQLLAGDSTPANIAFRAFLGRYAHYVLLRAQCFGGMFSEIVNDPSAKKATKSIQSSSLGKAITSSCLKNEHLEASQMLLKAGLACAMKDGEECENTAIALERVVSDLIGLTTAVATALNRALGSDTYERNDVDKDIVKKWCEFYSEELLPKTKAMVKSASPMLDAYGLFLPSRMGASVSSALLQKGLKAVPSDTAVKNSGTSSESELQEDEDVCREQEKEESKADSREKETEQVQEADEEGDDIYDEYEYDEYEYDEY
mmetsp:Transcript_15028/g.28284  ORF Transcript_15028/g.28284 Transcript_15028/m.28284 type:complete len:671 (+) Transcript_15028:343-2355(+)|eukprot:CAMPEP_0176495620 /NCGR_PEP_ID=MMETSP0200_2-20121128/10758_1 /TAXON_ID=947934 /ORGANISM="Chaetoceros sp., Strain GSL56" /LENGTH=670 /DNA_ID=CAMNT_0017893519 /DNA_START=296 /DNA_END=2308 /DNA_ORIENTATION=+